MQFNLISAPFNTNCECPEFRIEYKSKKRVKKATLYATAIGVYACYINGRRVGEDILAPGYTEYCDHLQYQTYDITDMLREENSISFLCGKGWACTPLSWYNGSFYEKIMLGFRIEIEYEDFEREILFSDENTSVYSSFITYADIYNGEVQDRTTVPEFLGYAENAGYETNYVEQKENYIREQEIITPLEYIISPKGERIIDFGQNITGYVRIKKEGVAGEIIRLRHAEVLDSEGNFYTGNLRNAKSEVTYKLKGGYEEMNPFLTYQGFRYICLDEYEKEPDLSCFEAVEVHTKMNKTCEFVCGNEKINQLYSNIVWGQKDNFLDVPTDCPQRDERLGWTGDAQVFARTAAINFDVEAFFEKWLCDVRAVQDKDGAIPPVIPRASKVRMMRYISAAWADCAVIVPWEMYRAYGNKKILEDNFECMTRWIEYMHNAGEEEFLWLGSEHFGDWLALDAGDGSYVGATDKDFIASCFFAYSTSLLIKSGKVLLKDMSVYERMYSNIQKAIKEKYISDGLPVCRTQTACVLLLHFNLCEDRKKVVELLCSLIRENNGGLTTGFVGTPYLLHTLSDNGEIKTAYDLLLREEYPSWLYSVNRGATTIWEHWDGIKEDGSFWSDAMNSFNHYAYGAVFDWVFKNAAGIDVIDGYEGYKKIKIAPKPDERLKFVKVSFDSVNGKIISDWYYKEDYIRYEITVPENTEAEITLPDGRNYSVGSGKYIYYSKR